jgi:hypothetical protein
MEYNAQELEKLFEETPMAPVVTTSVSTSQYAANRAKEMAGRIKTPDQAVNDSDNDIILYGETDPDAVEESTDLDDSFKTNLIEGLKIRENSLMKNWNEETERWYPYEDDDGWSIAFGHFITDPAEVERLKQEGITMDEALETLNDDYEEHLARTRRLITNFDELPDDLKAGLVDSVFNGFLSQSPKTIALINEGKFLEASEELVTGSIISKDYKEKPGTKNRVDVLRNPLIKYGKLQKK